MYGPSPQITRQKCPSGNMATSGLLIPDLRELKMVANEA